ncbi:MAG: hypothetical protein EZS28_002422 [Streblomastix strix]|uniref:Uncharacterized protein n=1 Tax=Streblomastix strix TaxID=222440 RepID=A0A5J4X421_9EUKA|nr:MAG: hypothetical protein EZS28_002422 [Streblomastix strix]
MTHNAKEIIAIYYGLLRIQQVFKKLQDQTKLPYNQYPRKTNINYKLALETKQIRRLYKKRWNNSNDFQDMELHATDRHIRDTIQQINYQLYNVDLNELGTHFYNAFNCKLNKVRLYVHPPQPTLFRVLQKLKQDKAQGIVIASIWQGQSWYTQLNNLSIKILFHKSTEMILEMGPKLKDMEKNFSPVNVSAILHELSQTLQLTKLLRELKIIGASAYSIRHSATTELAKLELMIQLCNLKVILPKKMKRQIMYLNNELRQLEKGVTNYYFRLPWRQGNDLLSPYLLISPLTHQKRVSQLRVQQKQGENSQKSRKFEHVE